MNPRFIVFDGNEGCGKSTQIKLLHDHLERQGEPVLLVRDPGTTRVGEMIRHILLDPANTDMAMRCEMLLYMAARAQMMHELIMPALKAGKTVLSDRFVSSTLAYQLGGDGLTAEQIRAVGDIAIGGHWPDLTIILDLPVEKSRLRVQAKFQKQTLFGTVSQPPTKDRIEERPVEYHVRVRENFLAQAEREPHRYHVINADRAPDAIHADVLKAFAAV
ncbi:MAG: thymidylate kinase [Phycisphaerales bacterium]|nr:thymidylate kinase [Phycisphaerales bacterium]